MHDAENDNPELKLAWGFLQETAENVFLTGKAGTGKTTFLYNLKKKSPKRMVVLAPTGVAAINAGGVTIHSFFQMPFGPWIPGNRAQPDADVLPGKRLSSQHYKFSREKLNIIRSLDLIVIDEISMVRADLLDGIDRLLRTFRDRDKPFGGVQMLMIGDLQQLAPIVKDNEWEILKRYYDTPFFFGSRAFKGSCHVVIELKRIYRQRDREFIDLLNRIRYGDVGPATLASLNKRYIPGCRTDAEGGIILTTHNRQAREINVGRMEKLPGSSRRFTALIEGEFPEYSYPTDPELELKEGARVMFVKNDSSPEKRYFNGKIGTIEAIRNDIVYVKCPGDAGAIAVEPEVWQNVRYALNVDNGEITETVVGTFTQHPLKAAWAITIHKSQGLTFDKVVIDAGAAFAHGQVYVALSRCRTLEGLVLTAPISPRVIINDASVSSFTAAIQEKCPDEKRLRQAGAFYRQTLLLELFDFSPLQRSIGSLLNLISENRGNLFSDLVASIQTLAVNAKRELFDIAEKFTAQVDSLLEHNADVACNEPLQERVKKAIPWFLEKIDCCIEPVLRAADNIDIDNKETRKSILNCLNRLDRERAKKRACLEACREGFSVRAYLQARSKAAIEKPAVRKKSAGQECVDFSSPNPALNKKLKAWRAEKASSLSVPEFMILHRTTLMEICSRLPSSLRELKAVKGIGKRKMKEFGAEILELVRGFREENGLPCVASKEPAEESPSTPKVNTKQVTLDLFESGKSLKEIADHRGLALSTVEGHIAHFIASGRVGINQFMPPEKVSTISEYFLTHDSRELAPAKNHFGDEATYGELRMVIAHMGSAESEIMETAEGWTPYA
ncbi:MAG: helix-turn-helix domain-containing protein [Chitinispirillaceae bacterium]|nr:helix-turn-helix domain-containing protein [Chitinispirillaceae bacterium]